MQCQENAIGLAILYQVQDSAGNPRDISSFTTHELVFERPDKSVITRAANFQTTGADGILQYITINGDLVPYGSFQVQAHLKNASFEEYTEVAVFHANKNLIEA